MNPKETSNTFYVIKFFALLAIVLAHSSFQQIQNNLVVNILYGYARCGVVAFFIASGYYFNQKRFTNVLSMLKSRVNPIIIPWIIWGLIVYCTRFLKHSLYFNPVEIINWIMGSGNYLWFLTVLILCVCIFFILPNNNWVLWVLIVITFVSTLLTANNVGPFRVLRIDDTALVFTYLDSYLNVFNWVGFFSIGILLKRYKIFEKYGNIFFGNRKWFTLILLPIVFIMIVVEKGTSYWTNLSIFIELIFFFILLVVSININHFKIFQRIGAVTLPIYLIHVLIEGFIFNKVFPQSIIMGVLRPIISVFCIYYLLKFGLFVSKKCRLEKIYKVIFGIKNSMEVK